MSDSGLQEALVRAALTLRDAGLLAASLGNLSIRAPEGVLITPTGLPYEWMQPQDVVLISHDGEILGGAREPSSEWRLHAAIYAAREDAQAVVHTHGTDAIAWSFLETELDTGTEELELYAGGAVRTAPGSPAGSDELAEACVAALAERRAALMARHGAVALGETLDEAVNTSIVVERQARLAITLRRLGAG